MYTYNPEACRAVGHKKHMPPKMESIPDEKKSWTRLCYNVIDFQKIFEIKIRKSSNGIQILILFQCF